MAFKPSSSVSAKATGLSPVFTLVREVAIILWREGSKEEEVFLFYEVAQK